MKARDLRLQRPSHPHGLPKRRFDQDAAEGAIYGGGVSQAVKMPAAWADQRDHLAADG
jgi:hypothetical protein